MSKTDTLRDAIIADANDVTVANGFNTTIGQVSAFPLLAAEAILPAFCLVEGGGVVSDPEAFTGRTGLATATFNGRLFIKSTTPHQVLDNFQDDIRNAIERTTGNTVGVSNVEAATVSFGDTSIAARQGREDTDSGSVHRRDCEIEVRYLYTRGSL